MTERKHKKDTLILLPSFQPLQVTSNRVEQFHARDEVLRGLPLTASCYKHLEDYSVLMAQRRLQVENDIKKGHKISPHIEAIVEERTVGHARTEWKVNIVSVEADQTVIHYLVNSPHNNVSFPVIIRAGTVMGETMQPQEMALSADGKLRWHQRCVCPCEYTIALGYPCVHAGLCLALNRLWVEKFNASGKGKKELVCPNDLFWWKDAKYFHPDYDIQTALKQCSGDTTSVIPPRTVEPEGWQLYPPFTSIPRMRRKKRRAQRQRLKTAKGPQIKRNDAAAKAPTAAPDENSAAYFLAYMTDPTSASSSSSSSGVETGQAAAAAPPKVVSDLNHCHACGQTSVFCCLEVSAQPEMVHRTRMRWQFQTDLRPYDLHINASTYDRKNVPPSDKMAAISLRNPNMTYLEARPVEIER